MSDDHHDPSQPPAGPAPFDLSERIAYVPGGYGGIGEAIVWGLALAGAEVVVAGRSADKAQALADAAAQGQVCTVANDNDPAQVVLSGHREAIERAIAMVKDHGIKRGMLLPVSAPFHCPLMQPAADAMAEALAGFSLLTWSASFTFLQMQRLWRP